MILGQVIFRLINFSEYLPSLESTKILHLKKNLLFLLLLLFFAIIIIIRYLFIVLMVNTPLEIRIVNFVEKYMRLPLGVSDAAPSGASDEAPGTRSDDVRRDDALLWQQSETGLRTTRSLGRGHR